MQRPEHDFDEDATGLALTLIRTFGADALPMVEEQATACADHPELHRRWSRIRDALASLIWANAHMEAALDLLDGVGELSITPTLVQAIALLGLRQEGQQPTGGDATVNSCGIAYFEERAQRHLDLAQQSADVVVKSRHLDAASYYASAREQIDRPVPPPA